MDTLLQWLNEPGPIRLVVDVVVVPILVFALIFAIRAILLRVTVPGRAFRVYEGVRRGTTKVIAILASLLAISFYWDRRIVDLAGRRRESLEQQQALADWLTGSANAVIATVILVLLLLAVNRSFKYGVARLNAWKESREGVQLQGKVLVTPGRVRQFSVLGMRVARFVLTILLFYFYVPLVLNFIPATRPLAGRVMPLVIGPAEDIGLSILGYLPRLVSVILIVIGVRYFLRLLSFVMAAVGKGEITIPGFEPEWADQTGRLAKIIVILGTIMLLYPFMPGAGSDVFKGFSVFVGALFTLGASSSVSNVISGVILTYTRSFRIGDRIEIGDSMGDVISRGLFVTRLRTIYQEEVTVPNALALGRHVTNYSAAVRNGALGLTVSAGIGYDVDWRQVHELMKNAARNTDHVLDEPEPLVLQHSLDDFAVEYELRVWTDDAKHMVRTKSALRQNVLDQFNEAGVEIMTPSVNAVRNSAEPAIPESYVGETPSPALRFLSLQAGTS